MKVRRLLLSGADNVRDLGGYRTESGKVTQWGVFVRSEDLNLLDEADAALLHDYGIRTIIDLRCAFEENRNKYLHRDIAYRNIPIVESYEDFVGGYYFHMIKNCKDNIRQVFEYMGRQSGYGGILFHCSMGRDRTGIISGILLLLCGVPLLDVVADYMATAVYMKPFVVRHGLDEKELVIYPFEIERMIDYFVKEHSGVEGYLLSAGVLAETIDHIKKYFISEDGL